MTVGPGVHRSVDAATWQPLVVGRQLGEEIVSIGDTMVMVGSAGACVEIDSRCDAAAWRSIDGGATCDAVPESLPILGIERLHSLPCGPDEVGRAPRAG